MVNLTKNGAKFVNLINMEELDKWDVDIDDELRQVFGDEDIAHLCTLTEQVNLMMPNLMQFKLWLLG